MDDIICGTEKDGYRLQNSNRYTLCVNINGGVFRCTLLCCGIYPRKREFLNNIMTRDSVAIRVNRLQRNKNQIVEVITPIDIQVVQQ